jgi:membrane protein
LRRAWVYLRDTVTEFIADRAMQQAAAIAFYTMLSLAPLLVIAIAVSGWVFGREAAQGAIVREFSGVLGEDAGTMIETVVQKAGENPGNGVIATVLGVVMLLIGAIGVFGQLKSALNTIWNVQVRPGGGINGFVREYLLSFTMVVCVAFLLLASLAVSAVIAAVSTGLGDRFSGVAWAGAVLHIVIAIVVIAALFAAMYKLLPDVRIAWRDVLLGALVTSVLFNLGKFLIGMYLGQASIVGVYGAAGSLVMVLLWVYYSAIIVLFGAEFTQVYALRRGARIVPSARAEWASCEDRAEAKPLARESEARSPSQARPSRV